MTTASENNSMARISATQSKTFNKLFYGDNLDILREYIKNETVDLCYIDPPFNSQRNYNQIYNNVGSDDRAQAQAFIDTWTWDDQANEGYDEIIKNKRDNARAFYTEKTIDLIRGLRCVLGQGSLLAYLVSMARRVVEIHRVLKSTGSFYLHCDPKASHYLKLLLDSIFCAQGGCFRNEIIWSYESGGRGVKDFSKKHDVIFRYTKSKIWTFNANDVLLDRATTRHNHMKRGVDPDGRIYHSIVSNGKLYKYYDDIGVIPSDVWTEFSHMQQKDPRRLGYPTQKPDDLLERIVRASSNEGDVVLDAFCGCGTTVAVAENLKRRWIGMDITYTAIALILKRLEDAFGDKILPCLLGSAC